MDKKLILVIDDDRDLVASLEAFLSARGYEVVTAGNLDVMMDYDEEGMVFASALKTDGPTRDIPILMMSGFSVQADVRDKVISSLMGQDLPVETFLEKPVRLTEVAERVEALLNRQSPPKASLPDREA
jgi:DNA-binding response OmpR family regulator